MTRIALKKEHKLVSRLQVVDKQYDTQLPQDERSKLSRHCLGTVIVKEPSVLTDSKSFVQALYIILKKEEVQCLGHVNHTFYNNSFTTVVALAESHISVHTWPERHAVQLDVFLCNYMNNNTQKCQRIFDAIVKYFDPIEVDQTFIERF